MAGNRLGSRARFLYESEEANVIYIIETDADLAVAGTGPGAAAPTPYDPSAEPPAGATICPPPKRFEPRGVWVKATSGTGRKFLKCFSNAAPLYATSTPTEVTIDGETFVTTGRIGEKQSF